MEGCCFGIVLGNLVTETHSYLIRWSCQMWIDIKQLLVFIVLHLFMTKGKYTLNIKTNYWFSMINDVYSIVIIRFYNIIFHDSQHRPNKQ